MFLSRIETDYIGGFITEPPLALHSEIHCPTCGKRVATIQLVKGKHAAKMNQGAIQPL